MRQKCQLAIRAQVPISITSPMPLSSVNLNSDQSTNNGKLLVFGCCLSPEAFGTQFGQTGS